MVRPILTRAGFGQHEPINLAQSSWLLLMNSLWISSIRLQRNNCFDAVAASQASLRRPQTLSDKAVASTGEP